jgi:uncharacterized protein (DUF433 family)
VFVTIIKGRSPKGGRFYNEIIKFPRDLPMNHQRITLNPNVMGGKPCIRGMRVTVGTVVGLVASGHAIEAILDDYPYLEKEDIFAALSYGS